MKNFLVIFCFYLGFFAEFGLDPVQTIRAAVSRNVCPPIRIQNGLAKRRSPRSRMVRFFCNRGYLLAGEKHSTCVRKTWDPAPPKCVRPTCKGIGQQLNVDNLLVYRTHSNSVQHFFCKAGYFLNGPAVIYCNGLTWSNTVPTCLATNTTAMLSCDFESPDLCGWTHDLNHDFDWTRENYNTPSGSIGTGPSFDHTKGIGKGGYYMYIESSSRAENDTARLISPVYNKMESDVCFEFFYHMFGATIGTLRVYVKNVGDSWNLDPESAIFSKSGNQGDRWYRSYQHLGILQNEFQFIIEGVRGAGYVSDIAIDDIRIIPNCTDEEETTTVIDNSTSNEVIPMVDTCENRCGQSEPTTHENDHLTCDCDDDCFGNNRCCPDFYDTCAGTTSADDFDTGITSEENAVTENSTVTTERFWDVTSSITINNRNVHYWTESESKQTSTLTTKTTIPTTKHPTTTTTTFIKMTSLSPTKATTLRNLKTTTKSNLITTKNSTIIRPLIYLQTRPITHPIYRKILSTTPQPFIIMKNTTKSDKETNNINDMIEVPMPTDIDKGSNDILKEYVSDEIENSVDTPFLGNFSETNKLFSQTYVETTNSNFLILGISLVGVIALISVVVFVIIRRYRFSRVLISLNGESQSDVRYLTGEESIDFSLDDCYNDK